MSRVALCQTCIDFGEGFPGITSGVGPSRLLQDGERCEVCHSWELAVSRSTEAPSRFLVPLCQECIDIADADNLPGDPLAGVGPSRLPEAGERCVVCKEVRE